MSGWSDDPKQALNPGVRPGEEGPAVPPAWARVAFRLSLALLVLLAGMAVAAPFQAPRAEVAACAAPALAAPDLHVIVLPPGHPPIPGLQPPSGAATGLPPGHPPVDAQASGRRARPLPVAPAFEPPASVDL